MRPHVHLANLTYDEKMAAEAVRAGVLPPLVAMLKREDARQLQQEALMATVNITAANAADGCRHEEQLVECAAPRRRHAPRAAPPPPRAAPPPPRAVHGFRAGCPRGPRCRAAQVRRARAARRVDDVQRRGARRAGAGDDAPLETTLHL